MSQKTHGRRPINSPLRFEPLEGRLPLAVATFNVNLYEDQGGVPGGLLANDTVEVGQSFFVEITAREWDPVRSGLGGVALDLAWDPDILHESDAGFDLNQILTSNLPAFRGGRLDNAAGTIENLSGAAMTASNYGRPIGNLWEERFALLHFTASNVGQTTLDMNPGISAIVTVPVATLSGSKVWFEPQTITVVPHAAAPPEAAPAADAAKPQADAPSIEEVPAIDPVSDANENTAEVDQGSSDSQAFVPPASPVAPVAEVTTTDALPDWFLNDRFIGPWELVYILPPAFPVETLTELKQSAHAAIDAVFTEWQQVQATRESWLDGVEHWNERIRREIASSRLVAHLMHYLAMA